MTVADVKANALTAVNHAAAEAPRKGSSGPGPSPVGRKRVAISLIVGSIIAVALMYNGVLGGTPRGSGVAAYGRMAATGDTPGSDNPGVLRRGTRKHDRKSIRDAKKKLKWRKGGHQKHGAKIGARRAGRHKDAGSESVFDHLVAKDDHGRRGHLGIPATRIIDPVDLSACNTRGVPRMSPAQHASCVRQLSESVAISSVIVDELDEQQLAVMVEAANQVPTEIAGTRHGSDGGLAALATTAGGTPSEEILLALQTLSEAAYNEAVESNAGAVDARNTLIFELLLRTAIPENVFQSCTDLRLAELASRLPTVPASKRLLASAGENLRRDLKASRFPRHISFRDRASWFISLGARAPVS